MKIVKASYLTQKIKQIREFSKCGMITLSKHAIERAKERNVPTYEIQEMLTDRNNYITQHRHHDCRKNQKDNSSYVITAKNRRNHQSYNIVLYDNETQTGGHDYVVSTVYPITDEKAARNNRYIKNKRQQKYCFERTNNSHAR